MYKITFYSDEKGRSSVKEYIDQLSSKTDKDSRIKLAKIRDYISALSQKGTYLGEPYVKHLDGSIWELRPLRDRILFATWIDNEFVLLHCFMKQTQKTPRREIEKALRNLIDYKNRNGEVL